MIQVTNDLDSSFSNQLTDRYQLWDSNGLGYPGHAARTADHLVRTRRERHDGLSCLTSWTSTKMDALTSLSCGSDWQAEGFPAALWRGWASWTSVWHTLFFSPVTPTVALFPIKKLTVVYIKVLIKAFCSRNCTVPDACGLFESQSMIPSFVFG